MYDRVLEIDPGNVLTLYGKDVALLRFGKYQEALTWFDKALFIDPVNLNALTGKGAALDSLGKYEEAITWYDKALEIDPADIDILNNKAVAISKLTPDFPDTNPKSTVLLMLFYTMPVSYHWRLLPLFLFRILVPPTSSS